MVFLNIRRIAVRRLLFFEDFYRYWKGLPKKKEKKETGLQNCLWHLCDDAKEALTFWLYPSM